MRNRDNLTQIVGGLAAGSTHEFELVRGGARMKLSVRIGVRDDKDEVAPPKNLWPGMAVAKLSDELRCGGEGRRGRGRPPRRRRDRSRDPGREGGSAGRRRDRLGERDVREKRHGLLPGAERHREAQRELRGEPGGQGDHDRAAALSPPSTHARITGTGRPPRGGLPALRDARCFARGGCVRQWLTKALWERSANG